MEKESFEDEETAEVLNKYFISIKVDREERPDIDSVYMNVTQMITGQGGWPMSIFMDNDKKPIYAGTYFPKRNGKYGSTGFIPLLEQIASLWKNDRVSLFNNSKRIMEEIQISEMKKTTSKNIDCEKAVQKCFNQLKNNFDSKYGGFGISPKFPTPHNLLFLLRYYLCTKNAEALDIVEKTLMCMQSGGIYDHIGFGFCRYSTDRMWFVPHFEKMLYDNALLALAYCETYHCTKNPIYAKTAEEIFAYIKRDMIAENGGFMSAEDADSEGEEGKFYLFTKEEVVKLLGVDDGEKFCNEYDITPEGNFEFGGLNIPNLIKINQDKQNSADDISISTSTNEGKKEKEREFFDKCIKKLFDYREKRIHPFKDDKILTSWNGLMICAFAYGGKVLDNDEYINIAERAAEFILENMVDENNNLYARYRDGEAKFNAVADDYAYLVWGLIELYESTFKKKYLVEAYKLNAVLVDNFWESGALYLIGKESETLISRPRDIYDGAVPSANSVSINNFIRLARLCGDNNLEEMALEIIRFFGRTLDETPYGHSFAMCGVIYISPLAFSREIIISGEKSSEFIDIINSVYSPFTVTACADSEIAQDFELYSTYTKKQADEKTHIYICENNTCGLPITTVKELKNILQIE